MDPDAIANAIKAALDDAEAFVASLPDGADKTRGLRLAALAHASLLEWKLWAVGSGHVQQDSGGDPKP